MHTAAKRMPRMNTPSSELLESTDRVAVSAPNRDVVPQTWDGPVPEWLRPVREALAGLLELTENWNSYGAPPIGVDATDRALVLLLQTMQPDTPAPHVVP